MTFIKEKYLKDFEIINDNNEKGKGKGKTRSSDQNVTFKHKQIYDPNNPNNIINSIVDEITCPITYEPADQFTGRSSTIVQIPILDNSTFS